VKFLRYRFFAVLLLIVHWTTSSGAQTTGSLTGTIRDAETKETIPNVNIRFKETPMGSASDLNGRYTIGNIPPGSYTVVVSSVGYESVEAAVQIQVGTTARRDFELKPSTIQVGEVLVYGASLRRERITEAPAAVSVINAKDIARGGGHGQLPKLLESEPGVDMVQSGLYDFNVNTRGFNSSLNRRLLILLDGRDLGTAFLSATEWNAMTIPLEELGRIELVRGPGSALYGANAYNGVLNITSLPPKASLGTRAIVGAGELHAYRGDVRHSGVFGPWSYRINVGHMQGGTFSVSRPIDPNGLRENPPVVRPRFEYEGLNPFLNREIIDTSAQNSRLSPVKSSYGSVRVDYDFPEGGVLVAEGGISQVENEVIVTGIGRVQVQKARRPWGRLSYSGQGLSLMVWANGRYNSKPERSFSTGLNLTQDALITHGEIQYSFSPMENLFVVAGASHRIYDIDTKGTLMQTPRTDNMSGLFSQAEYKFSENLKGVVAARWDRSTLTESFFSPKAAVVWTPIAGHTIRATYNKAFQQPNYSELYLYVKHPTSALLYSGNSSLKVEKITGYEIGYKGVFENRLFVTFDGYYNQLKDFITDLGPGLNPNYPPTIILPGETVPRNIWSYTNAGKVNEAGFELAATLYLSESWHVDANYSLFTFEVVEKHQNDVLLPNSPPYKINGGITYTDPAGHSVNLSAKYVPGFDWAAGIFRGPIPAYTLVNLTGTYVLSSSYTINLNVSNLLDRKHYQIFGGSLLGRRAMVTLTASF
jgi:iron complex outermembrane receptor protein